MSSGARKWLVRNATPRYLTRFCEVGRAVGRRTNNRVKAVLPVRMYGNDAAGKPFSLMLYTLDISPTGARVGGFRGSLNVGDTVGIQYRNYNVRHRICWIKPSAKDTLLGIESLQPDKEIWGVKPAAFKDDYVVPETPAPRKYEKRPNDRRRYTRFPISGVAVVSNPVGNEKQTLRLGDISLEGCFIETAHPFPIGARLEMLIKVQETEIETVATVRVSLANAGMGVQFTHLAISEAKHLYALLKRLGAEEAGRTGTTADSNAI